jgi:hypothetical protein
MAQVVDRELAAIGIRLIDDAHMVWAAASAESARTLRMWFDGIAPNREGYCAYLAALDREEAAARDLQRLSAVSEPCAAALRGSDQARDCERPA